MPSPRSDQVTCSTRQRPRKPRAGRSVNGADGAPPCRRMAVLAAAPHRADRWTRPAAGASEGTPAELAGDGVEASQQRKPRASGRGRAAVITASGRTNSGAREDTGGTCRPAFPRAGGERPEPGASPRKRGLRASPLWVARLPDEAEAGEEYGARGHLGRPRPQALGQAPGEQRAAKQYEHAQQGHDPESPSSPGAAGGTAWEEVEALEAGRGRGRRGRCWARGRGRRGSGGRWRLAATRYRVRLPQAQCGQNAGRDLAQVGAPSGWRPGPHLSPRR